MIKQNLLQLRNLLSNSFFKTTLLWSIILFVGKCYSQNIEIIKFKDLQPQVFNQSDTCYVVNFFASWCKPCINEIPEFVYFAKGTKNKKIKLVFVSLDLKNDQGKLLQIVQKYNLQNVYLLDETNADNWINKIDKQWSGAIPATLIIKKGKHKKFIADAISSEMLFKLTK